tara:strand:- start:92 stop:748 length:657 start_codon:yes stop_codon:yes gene_type:complete
MDGTYNWYDIPDVSTNTKVFTIDAPKEFRDINYNLVDYIHKQNGKGEGAHDSINAGVSLFTGWKSFDSPHMQQLLDWIGSVIIGYNQSITDYLPVFTQVWGMGYELNDVTPAHNHDPAGISWTYYPYVEDPEIAQPLEICTVPDGSIEMDLSMCAEHVQDKTKQWGETLLTIPPHTGQLVIFPAYCYHQVKPVTVETQRYCIAGNVHHDFENATSFNT